MCRFRTRALMLALASSGVMATGAPATAQQVYTLEPPAEIGPLLEKLRKREDRVRATNALAVRDQAAPYLRLELTSTTDKFSRSVPVRAVESSLIICDGDVELFGHLWRERCVIIANGNIRAAEEKSIPITRSLLCAAGDIIQTTPGGDNNLFLAGGSVKFALPPKNVAEIREKQKSLSFGVRFLDPVDFGLILAAQNGGVQVMGIRSDSPFARYGVKDGDVITVIDDVTTDSIPQFRRQLRRGVLAESVVLRIRRGNERITRIVFLDGIPLPAAPPPREAKS